MQYLLAVSALCLLAAPMQSQATPPLRIGQRVWVRLSLLTDALNSDLKGTLEGFTDDSLRLGLEGQGHAVSVALNEQTQLFVFTGRRSSVGRGAVIGGGVGVVVGAIMGFAAGERCFEDEFFCFGRGTLAAAGAAGLGGIGLIGGLIVGALSSHDSWAPAGWSRTVRPVVTPSPHGVGFGLSLSF